MGRVLRNVLASLRQPDDQGDDWFAWGSVQLAHAAIGVGGAGAIILAWGAPLTAALIVAGVYAAAKELPDLIRAPSWRTARDCLRDALFVAGGAFVAAAIARDDALGFAGAMVAILAALADGVYQRARRAAAS